MLNFLATKKRLFTFLAFALVLVTIPLTVIISMQQQNVRQRASGKQIDLYFSTARNCDNPLTKTNFTPNQATSLSLCLSSGSGYVSGISGFNITLSASNNLTFQSANSADGANRFDSKPSPQRIDLNRAVHFTRIRTSDNILDTPLRILDFSVVATNTDKGDITISTAEIVSLTQEELLTVENSDLSYGIETTPTPIPAQPAVATFNCQDKNCSADQTCVRSGNGSTDCIAKNSGVIGANCGNIDGAINNEACDSRLACDPSSLRCSVAPITITSVTTKIIGGFVEATATLSEDFPRDLSMKCTYNDGGTTETVSSVLSNPRVGRQANKVINSSFQPKSANWSLAECSIFEYGKTEPLATYIPTTTPNKTLSPNATTVNISLSKGDNFISLPVIPANNSITTLISSIEDKIETIFLYNSADETWKGYIPGPAADDLSTLEPGKGYMIRMKEAATLTVTGDPYEFEPIALQANKQYPLGIGFSSVKVSETLGTCNLSDIQIQSVNSNGSTMEITLNPNTILETKKGYWIKSTNNCTLSRIPALSQIPSASPALSATPKSLQILLTVGQQGLSGLPINQNKKVTVFIRGDDGKVTKKTVTLPYKNNAVFGKEEFEHAFQGNIDLSALSIGRSYKIRVESGSFLKSRTINLNVSENTNSIIATLLVGLAENTDFTDKDNIDAISFFNGLKSCFGSTIANKKSSCSNPGDIDLTGDGNVDQFDFNIFIKGIQNLKQGLPIQ